MKQIKILGSGCARCTKLYQAADEAAKALGLDYHIEKVTDIAQIMGYGVMTTPALVVDGQVKVAGRIPTAEELKQTLS